MDSTLNIRLLIRSVISENNAIRSQKNVVLIILYKLAMSLWYNIAYFMNLIVLLKYKM